MNWMQPTEEQETEWARWVAERPAHVRAVAEKFTPWILYRLTTTGQRCSVIGFHESDNTEVPVTVYIHAEHPVLGEMSARNVFGINPASLVPWTAEDEPPHALPSSFSGDRGPEQQVP